jgi:Na+/H+ antiporter NhaD/arsenite permease-like protein
VVVSVTRQAGLPPLPFALITVWLANTGSLLLPISNLTNLLAQHSLGGISPAGFAAMWAPSLAAVLVPLVFVGLAFRRDLRKRYSRIPVGRVRPDAQTGSPTTASTDRVLLGGAAVVLCVMFVLRRPRVLKVQLVPWSLLLFASGLFLVMETARQLGTSAFMGRLAGEGQGFPEQLRLAATGALGSNVLNNLPAYLLAEPLAETPQRMAALLIGANAGPLITPWAPLATLLWHDRLVRMNVLITWRGYALFGLMVAPLTVFAAVLALAAAG